MYTILIYTLYQLVYTIEWDIPKRQITWYIPWYISKKGVIYSGISHIAYHMVYHIAFWPVVGMWHITVFFDIYHGIYHVFCIYHGIYHGIWRFDLLLGCGTSRFFMVYIDFSRDILGRPWVYTCIYRSISQCHITKVCYTSAKVWYVRWPFVI